MGPPDFLACGLSQWFVQMGQEETAVTYFQDLVCTLRCPIGHQLQNTSAKMSQTMNLSSLLSSKTVDAELNTKEAIVGEETRAPNRGFVSIFIEISRSYTRGECEENKILHM